jgi:hypothetical protein
LKKKKKKNIKKREKYRYFIQTLQLRTFSGGFEVVLCEKVYICLNGLQLVCRFLTKKLEIMAKIKFGMMMVDARGKLGGQVFSKNRAGAYIRTKVTPSNPQTDSQTSVRATFAVFSQKWSALSEEQRIGWNGAVASWSTTDIFGDLRNPTGKNLYLKLNQQAYMAGLASFDEVPQKAEMVQGVITEGFIEPLNRVIQLQGLYEGLAGEGAFILYGCAPVTQGTSYVKNKMRQLYAFPLEGWDSDFGYVKYAEKFGEVKEGDKIFLGVKYVLNNGQASPLQTFLATIEI